jgi:hypothetical protein
MAVSGIRMLDESGIKGYEIKSEMRFNFPNKEYQLPKGKLNRFLDTLMAEKAKIPSPDKYTG